MNLNDKIKQVLMEKNISPSHFADEIGVQRSSISHILAGRNKPSLDIVQKIVRRYPDLGVEWILEDDFESMPEEHLSSSKSRENDPFSGRNSGNSSPRDLFNQNAPYPNPGQSNLRPNKVIEKILVFYQDGTFKEYRPE